jgi:release factor glutamine methyltransferase
VANGFSPDLAQPITAGEALAYARARLAGLEDGSLTAQVILAHVLGEPRASVLAHPERALPAQQGRAYAALVARAAAGTPLAYLTGEREFCGLALWVSPAVLVPRPESEQLVDLAVAALQRQAPPGQAPPRLLDVGTGSGNLAVAIAAQVPQAVVWATDLSAEALALARRNASRHGLASRINFAQGDLFAALPPGTPPFDVIVANLPYIDSAELAALAVARHEPALALDGGPGGLALVGSLLAQAPAHLVPGGVALLEIGAGQGPAAAALAWAACPGAAVAVHSDLAGLDRVLAVEL